MILKILLLHWNVYVHLISQKRRSARNTHRKKYVDDIMLSISDDDSPKEGTPKQDTSKASSDDAVDPAVKPNFVYIVSMMSVEMEKLHATVGIVKS